MTNIQEIKKRWDETERAYQALSFEQAKADMDSLMQEVERLQEVEKEKEVAEGMLRSEALRFKNMQQEIVSEIEKVVRKYDTY